MKRHHAKIVQYILGGLILLHYLILELSEEDLPWWSCGAVKTTSVKQRPVT